MDTVETTPILIGRDDGCHVKLDKLKDLSVSSQHAQVDMIREGVYQLANLSRNGTFLNGTAVEAAVQLQNHSVIQLGRDGPRLRFDADERVGGISFAAEKEKKTGKLERGRLGPAPDTEERPAFKLDDVEGAKSDGDSGFGVPVIALMVLVAALLIGGVLYVVFRR